MATRTVGLEYWCEDCFRGESTVSRQAHPIRHPDNYRTKIVNDPLYVSWKEFFQRVENLSPASCMAVYTEPHQTVKGLMQNLWLWSKRVEAKITLRRSLTTNAVYVRALRHGKSAPAGARNGIGKCRPASRLDKYQRKTEVKAPQR